MGTGYFHRVANETGTRIWVNNPSPRETELAIDEGAIGCTTNPSHCSKLLSSDPGYIRHIIDETVRECTENDAAAETVYQKAASQVMRAFLPLFESSRGTSGFVTVQGDPRRDGDPDSIVEESLRFRALGSNYMAKIPITNAGLRAIRVLLAKGIPICATEVFSISQAVCICELYRQVTTETKSRPPFYVTHITGIFDELMSNTVKAEHIDIAPDVLSQAGCIVARKEYRILKDRMDDAIFLGGGARGSNHFTEFVGADMCITLNWNTIASLCEADGPVMNRIGAETPQPVIDELCRKVPNFRRAYFEDALTIDEFADFGPLVFFRTQFLNGYARLLDEIAERRAIQASKNREQVRSIDHV